MAGTDFTAAGTTLTFTTAPASGVGVDVYFLGLELSIPTPADASVTAAKLASDAVTGAKIADDAIDSEHYTDGSIDLAHMSSESVDEDNLHISNAGSNGNFLSKQSGDAGGLTWASVSAGLTLGTEQASTSGTGITFTGIPSGTKLIFMTLEGVSMSGTNNYALQLGDSGGLEVSGFSEDTSVSVKGDGTISGVSSGGAMPLPGGDAGAAVTGVIMMVLKDSSANTWACSHSLVIKGYNQYRAAMGGGVKSLSGELTQIRMDNNGSDTFDAGSINIAYL